MSHDIKAAPAPVPIDDDIKEKDEFLETPADPPIIDSATRARVHEHYSRQDEILSSEHAKFMEQKIAEMSEERALEVLLRCIETHSDDPNFPSWTMEKIISLCKGSKVSDMDPFDWLFELKVEAATIHYHSPYPEIRAVCPPVDDPSIPVETLRAYILGIALMGGSTAMNTFFSPRQPGISLNGLVLQCILAPLGRACAKFLPDWGVTIRGHRMSLNPGPWTFKEQIFATILFAVGNGAGQTYYTYLTQMLPQYLGQTWVSFGYEMLLAIYAQMAGLGFAGMLRRFLIYPPAAIWPQVLPTLALNRTLVQVQPRGEVIHGWRLSRYQFFMSAFGLMFVYFWIPNSLFKSIRSFNWMTWISPRNISLAAITGFYGGMGFNPIATFDWNVSGSGSLVTPFFSEFQAYLGRVWSGLVIIALWYTNYKWGAYMPINSNETFNNKGKSYNISMVMAEDGLVDVAKLKDYGPPYYSSANMMGQANLPAWFAITLFYVTVRYWSLLRSAAIQLWRGWRNSDSEDPLADSHTRMMRAYAEVPDWWYAGVLLVSIGCGIAALSAWPTQTPWWSLLAVMAIGWVMLIPISLVIAIANISASLGILFKILSGVWFPGNPVALVILEAIGPAFDSRTDSFMGQQKLGHYAKIPPRAMFRGMVLSTLINCLIFIGVLNWMVNSYNKNGDLCTWGNPDHFVCSTAALMFSSAVMYGIYGTRNFYATYPATYCAAPIGAAVGVVVALLQKYGGRVKDYVRARVKESTYDRIDKYFFRPIDTLYWFNPAIFYAGVCATWTGGGNLSFHTNGLILSFIFMYHIKRRYPAWWKKYNFLLEAGFNVGVAVSGTVQTLAFAFSGKKVPDWWGNKITTAGVDFEMYNQKGALLPLPKKGYFGLERDEIPMLYPDSIMRRGS